MHTSEVRAFVPERDQLLGKDEQSCPLFHDDLAVLDPAKGFAVLAARGPSLFSAEAIKLSSEESAHLMASLGEELVGVLWEGKPLLVFPSLLAHTGLLPVILPHGDPATVARTLLCLPMSVCPSTALSALAERGQSPNELYGSITESVLHCKRVLSPKEPVDLRLHSAWVGALAGCRVDVTALPLEELSLLPSDLAKWTVFLLCVLLSLRGDSAQPSNLQAGERTEEAYALHFLHTSQQRSARHSPVKRLYAFMEHPAFSSFSLEKTAKGIVIDAVLHRRASLSLLHATSELLRFSVEITAEAS